VARVAPTFIRFGNFQMMAAAGELDNLRALADYTIRHHFAELGEPSPPVYLRWFEEICRRTAVMMAHWMTVGFVHGVMNTDNMSILGLTIDYGPYGWLEPYDPGWTPNTTDFGHRRYAFGQQPQIGMWNLTRLAEALALLVEKADDLRPGLEAYAATFAATRQELLLKKLGLTPQPTAEEDRRLVTDLLEAMAEAEVDMTIFFRRLSHAAPALLAAPEQAGQRFQEVLAEASYVSQPHPAHAPLFGWLHRYLVRLSQETRSPANIEADMLAANPKYVLRNFLAQNAIEAAEKGDLTYLHRLMEVLKKPFDEQPGNEEFAAKRPDWAWDMPGCATLSCSS
jgi:uncharacterized protein YdiU (UPF0061 family)